tara:strand:+ start:581 stop:913 length:333 start_codon:yes stop_codon:yes gene_type:complete
MKKVLYAAVIILFFGVSVWYVWTNKDQAYDADDMFAFAEQGECVDIGQINPESASQDGYGYWYFDIVPSAENEDINFTYSCEVNPYTGETKLVIEKAYNWYESDVNESSE